MRYFDIPYADFILAAGLMAVSLFLGGFNPANKFGLLIFVPSVVFWFLAKQQLAKAFSRKNEPKYLQQKGLYTKLRHPIYLFSLMAFLGVLISFGSEEFIFIFVLLAILQIYRAKTEEKHLIERFGGKYLKYKENTWF